jgi:hypothetical protein
MRLHGWCLFAGLNQVSEPNGPLYWQSWKTSTQAFPYQYNPWKGLAGEVLANRPSPLNSRNFANAKLGGANRINNPPPVYPITPAVAQKYPTCREPIPGHAGWYQLKDGVHMQSNGDIMVAGVIYNDAAINNILRTRLYDAVTLNSLLPKDKNGPPNAIPWFPASSIVLKPMFWPVQKGGFTALPVNPAPRPTANTRATKCSRSGPARSPLPTSPTRRRPRRSSTSMESTTARARN